MARSADGMASDARDRQSPKSSWAWRAALRGVQYSAEQTANLVRIAAVATFYAIHLVRYWGERRGGSFGGVLPTVGGTAELERFHILATLLALTWLAAALALQLALQQKSYGLRMAAAATAADVVLLTCLANLAAGPRSPLVTGYFLIIALAALRLSVPLVRGAALGAVAGYLCVLGAARWPEWWGRPADPSLLVPRYQQLLFASALAFAGIIAGQAVRCAQEFARRFAALRGAEAADAAAVAEGDATR